MNLSIFDLGIVVFYIALVFLSGILMKKYVSGIGDFLVADRTMGFNLGLVSMMCTEIGMITYVYYAELGYKAGFSSLVVAIPPMLAYFFLGKTGFIIKPLLEMKIMTIPEFFSKRFSKGVRFYVGIWYLMKTKVAQLFQFTQYGFRNIWANGHCNNLFVSSCSNCIR